MRRTDMPFRCLRRLIELPLEDWLILSLLLGTALYLLGSESFWSWSDCLLPF
jgi:hypothetical protein